MVVFVHGLIGSPDQFKDFADAAHERGCSVSALLLPGHGGTARDFTAHGLPDWEAHLDAELLRIASGHENVIVIGHSIGGLLALNASLCGRNRIKGVMLIASPLRLRCSPRPVWTGLRLSLYSRGGGEILEAYRRSGSVSSASILSYLLWTRQYMDVFKLIAKTRKNLARITVPVVAINSKKDETSSFSSLAILEKELVNAKFKAISLCDSWHAYFSPGERDIIRLEMLGLIDSCS